MCVCVCVCVSELWVGRRDWHKGRKWAHVLVKPQLIDEPALSKCEPELVLKTAWRYWMPLPDTHTHTHTIKQKKISQLFTLQPIFPFTLLTPSRHSCILQPALSCSKSQTSTR